MAVLDPDVHDAAPLVGAGTRRTTGVPTVRDRLVAATTARRHITRLLICADMVGLVVAAIIGPLLLSVVSSNPASAAGRTSDAILFGLAMIPVFLALFALYGLYQGVTRRVSNSVFSDLRNILHALLVGGFLVSIAAYLMRKYGSIVALSEAKAVAVCVAAAVTVPLGRGAAYTSVGRTSQAAARVVVVGTGKLAQTVASHLRAQSSVEFMGFVDDNPLDRANLLGTLEQLPELCHRLGIVRVVVCFSKTHPERTTEMLKSLSGQVGVSIVPRYYELITGRSHVEDLFGLPILDIAPASMSAGSRFVKRTFDLVASTTALVVLSPVLLASAVAVKLTSPGPVFFRQTRTGRNEAPFSVLKFRTMQENAEQLRADLLPRNEMDGPLFKLRDDPRVTRVGRVLRRTSLDELPQLINVWRGEMSLVGPRPFVVDEAAEIEGWARKRFEVRPGMTGLWQVSGRNELSHLELCRLDYLYVASWSLWWDMQILWRTPASVFKGRGAS